MNYLAAVLLFFLFIGEVYGMPGKNSLLIFTRCDTITPPNKLTKKGIDAGEKELKDLQQQYQKHHGKAARGYQANQHNDTYVWEYGMTSRHLGTMPALQEELIVDIEKDIKNSVGLKDLRSKGANSQPSYRPSSSLPSAYEPAHNDNWEPLLDPTSKTVNLHQIGFAPNSALLKRSSEAGLDNLATFLTEHSEIYAEIAAHTNAYTADDQAMELSGNRAKTVVMALIERGIDKSRLSYKGYGNTQPIASNATPEGRIQNQRLELKILKP